MKVLDVPQFFQEPGSYDCILVCVRMVMSYYGIPIDLEDMKESMHYVPKVGTSLYENGSFLLGKGFHTVAITAHPQLFPPETRPELMNSEGLIDPIKMLPFLQDKIVKATTDRDRLILRTFEEYVMKRGELKLEIPKFEHIQRAIDEGCPVIALLYAAAMGKNEGGFHGVLVIGYRDNKLLINNPSEASARQHWVSAEEFFYGLHASTCVDFDNGTLLVVGGTAGSPHVAPLRAVS